MLANLARSLGVADLPNQSEAADRRMLHLSAAPSRLIARLVNFVAAPKQVTVEGPNGQLYNLSRYYAEWDRPRPESFAQVCNYIGLVPFPESTFAVVWSVYQREWCRKGLRHILVGDTPKRKSELCLRCGASQMPSGCPLVLRFPFRDGLSFS
jgi:hypothetical protein